MTRHYIEKCSCGRVLSQRSGRVLSQCRCPDSNKRIEIVFNGCIDCIMKEKARYKIKKEENNSIEENSYDFDK